jgi:hypothetical protein
VDLHDRDNLRTTPQHDQDNLRTTPQHEKWDGRDLTQRLTERGGDAILVSGVFGEEGAGSAGPQASLVCGGSSGPAHGGGEAVRCAGTDERWQSKPRTTVTRLTGEENDGQQGVHGQYASLFIDALVREQNGQTDAWA